MKDKNFERFKDKKSKGTYNRDNRKTDRRDDKRDSQDQDDSRENIIEGRNPVLEVLKGERTVEKIYVAKGAVEGSINKIISIAKDRGIVISEVDRKNLDDMSTSGSHQGVIAITSPYKYASIEEMLELAETKGEDPFIIILDEIEDPHNLGSIVRSANSFGAHGVIIPKRRSAYVTATVSKSSAGAVEHTKIAKVTNLNSTIKELKDKGFWIMGADMDGEVSWKSNLTGPIGLVIGSEGKGISRLVRENCDTIISIPIVGEVNSLNASVAGGILMYEIVRQRNVKK